MALRICGLLALYLMPILETDSICAIPRAVRAHAQCTELLLTAAALEEILPPQFPQGASSMAGFHAFLVEAFAKEAGTLTAGSGDAAAVGVSMTCVSTEVAPAGGSNGEVQEKGGSQEKTKQYTAEIELMLGQGFMAMRFPVRPHPDCARCH